MRVHELAKDLNLPSKDLLDKLPFLAGKTPSSALTKEQVDHIRRTLGPKPPQAAAPQPAAAKPTPAPAPAPAPKPVEKAPEPEQEKQPTMTPDGRRIILITGPIVVRDFAEQLGLKPNQLITELMSMNIFASINQKIDLKIAQQIAEKHKCSLEHEKKPPKVIEIKLPEPKVAAADQKETKVRAPVVTFMGHVDHGKTSLLDRIRSSKVAAGEAGGITQHIGAYTITVKDRKITFLDTPGHEAFTAMRARGARITDIVVLVVDGVDGIMPQTKEAYQHAKAAGVTVMVAINKMDLRAANADRVKQQLQQLGITPEDWGGDVVCCPVSALSGEGVDHLLEMILLQAEMMELKAADKGPASGYVVEAQLEKGRGPTATLLVREGVLRVGDAVLCGPFWGRIKALMDYRGQQVKEVGPSDAVKALGLSDVPEAGAKFEVYPNDRAAREESEKRLGEKKLNDQAKTVRPKASLEDLFKTGPDGQGKKELTAILKADVQGSIEAIQHALSGIKSEKVTIRSLFTAVGNITGSDVLLASASDAVIIGFNVAADSSATALAKREGVEIRFYSIIYELIDQVKESMQDLLEPIVRENVIGHANVRQVFDLHKKGQVAGCLVNDGKVTSRARARVKRRGDVVYAGNVVSLRRFQNDASEVREGQECGIRLDNFGDFQAGDVIEVYEVEKIAQQL